MKAIYIIGIIISVWVGLFIIVTLIIAPLGAAFMQFIAEPWWNFLKRITKYKDI